MLSNYAFIGVFLIAAVAFPLIPLAAARLLAPKRPTPIKQSTYECGLEAIGDIRVQFKVQYYLYALSFLIFDVEVLFLYPWALAYGQLGIAALVGGGFFVLILVAGLVYEWKRRALEWV